jgi:FtsZ-interacting cell division protein ZipA
MNWLDQLYRLRDALQGEWDNPGVVLEALKTNHILLLEVVAILVISVFLLYLLFKPAKKKAVAHAEKNMPTVQKVGSRLAAKNVVTEPKLDVAKAREGVNRKVKAVQEEARQRSATKAPSEGHAKGQSANAATQWQDLSTDQEQALTAAMQAAGKQALAEVTGAPRQEEFFAEEGIANEAVKKMFAKTKPADEPVIEAVPEVAKPVATAGQRLDFLIIYYMAPHAQSYALTDLFKVFEGFNLYFNEDNVFEYTDQQGLQFYIASALKPGTFDLNKNEAIPGLSFILDLQKVKERRSAFNKMLIFIDALSKYLKGDILDERRQRMTIATMNEYLARIKSFNHT